MILDDLLITHAGGKQVRADFEVLFPAAHGFNAGALLGHWMIKHDFASAQWVNGRLLVKTTERKTE